MVSAIRKDNTTKFSVRVTPNPWKKFFNAVNIKTPFIYFWNRFLCVVQLDVSERGISMSGMFSPAMSFLPNKKLEVSGITGKNKTVSQRDQVRNEKCFSKIALYRGEAGNRYLDITSGYTRGLEYSAIPSALPSLRAALRQKNRRRAFLSMNAVFSSSSEAKLTSFKNRIYLSLIVVISLNGTWKFRANNLGSSSQYTLTTLCITTSTAPAIN